MGADDVKVFLEFIPTADSIRKGADQMAKELDKKLVKWGSAVGVPKLGTAANLAGGGEAAGAAGGMGGGGVLGALGKIGGILMVISVAAMIVSSFFEAVGPILRTLSKVLTAVILLLLAPFLKRLAPVLGQVITAILDTALGISKMLDYFLGGKSPTTEYREDIASAAADAKKAIEENTALSDKEKEERTKMVINAETMATKYADVMDKMFSFSFFIDPAGFLASNFDLFTSTLNVFFGTTLPTNLAEMWDKVKEKAWEQLVNIGTWFWDNIVTPFGIVLKAGIDGLFQTNWAMILEYAVAKLFEGLISAVNQVINIVKSFKFELPAISVPFMGRMITIFPGASFDPFGGMSNIAAPAGIGETISNFEGGGWKKAIGGANVQITNNITVDAGADREKAQELLRYLNKKQAEELRKKLSYFGGSS